MAKVSLRIYNRDIENLIDSGQLDEAIAHCRHILNTYPKHLETYRMLGKVYLEAKRYNEATDIFQRLLMAVPDDFVAHVGMSIINDEQRNLDAAIWHMERAFEVQPSNAAIQGELQRLVGRRDGLEPPKIRLNRGALSHMYVQGELYPQAISEIKSVLDEDPERQDMQVLLVRAYFHAGMKSEAAEICTQLLRRYPYCMEANRILAELLPETGESAQVYRQRVIELDPYAALASSSLFRTEDVADAGVSLDKLEWDGQPVVMDAAWETDQGIGLESGLAPEETPDWLKAAMEEDVPVASPPTDELAPASTGVPSEDDIPEFLREAGWTGATGAFQEGPDTFDQSTEGELAAGDLPDWVKAMAPEGADTAGDEPLDAASALPAEELPDWLEELEAEEEEQIGDKPEAKEDLPDWLQELQAESDAQDKALELSEEESVEPVEDEVAPLEIGQLEASQPEADAESLPDWLLEVSEQAEVEPSVGDEVPLPEALEEEAFDQPVESVVSLPEALEEEVFDQPVESEEPAAVDESLPDWFTEEETAQAPETELLPVETDLATDSEPAPAAVSFDAPQAESMGTTAVEQDDAFAWLENLAAKHGAKPEELLTQPEERLESEPDWVQKAKAQAETEPAEDVPATQPAEEPEISFDVPDFLAEDELEPAGEPDAKLSGVDTGELGKSALEQDDAFAWLEGLAAKHGAKSEELLTKPEERRESEPDWVQKAKDIGDSVPSEVLSDEEPVEPVVEKPVQFGAEAPVESAEADETGIWLRDKADAEDFGLDDVAEMQTAEAEPIEESPEQVPVEDDAPDWLKSMETGDLPVETPSQPADLEDIPDWLRATEEPEPPKAEASEETEAEAPLSDWLTSLDEEKPTEQDQVEGEGEEGLPAWLSDLDSGPAKAEPVAADEEISAWLKEELEQEELHAEPTSPSDWQPTGTDEKHEAAPEPLQETVMAQRSGMTGMLSSTQDIGLAEAQAELSVGNIPAALDGYAKLIKKGRLLDEVIFDLREALYRYPVEVPVWQSLGDAYMRANRLQDALEAYTKAEELLR